MPTRKGPGPSVKDPELYEALRDEGNSKQKSARIANAAANTSRKAVGKKGGSSGDYDDWTVGGPAQAGRRDRRRGPVEHEEGRADQGAAQQLIRCRPGAAP